MVKVYFENEGGKYAEHVATFESEEIYIYLLPAIEKLANIMGFDKVTESIELKSL